MNIINILFIKNTYIIQQINIRALLNLDVGARYIIHAYVLYYFMLIIN